MTTFLRRLAHYAVYAVAGVVILLSLTALTLRFLVMPEIGRYRPEVEAAAGKALGMPVHIQALRADWLHFNPHITLENVSLNPPSQPEPLHIARVEATLSWLSLMLLEPHLASLDIYRPALDVRRDKDGSIFVAGIPVNRGGPSSPLPDWLLRQRTVTVSDGRVTWIDGLLGAPPLTLEHLDFGLDNHFHRHRFGLTARPPVHAMARLDVRGDLHGRSVENWSDWRGRIYLRADGASAAALNTWSPWAQTAVRRSIGNVRFWLDFAQGRVQDVTGDVDLKDVAVSLAEDVPDMAFADISGRLRWSQQDRVQTYSLQSLRFVTASGQTAEPANFRLSFIPTAAGKLEAAHVEADSLRLEALTAVSGAIPMPRQTHDWIAAINPHGFVEHVDFNWLGKDQFRLSARFRDAGMNATRTLPGFTGLNGTVEADNDKGHIKLDSRHIHFVYDKVFRQPIELDRFAAEARWSGKPGSGYQVSLDKCDLSNADLDGSAHGTLTLTRGKSPTMNLQAQLTRGDGGAVWRYLPHQVDDSAYAWLKQSIVSGHSSDTRLTLRGPLDRFPFDRGDGLFQVKVRIEDGVLAYAEDWPRITGIDGWLTFQGKSMTITTDRGDILGASLPAVQAAIPDLWQSDGKTLELNGRAVGPTARFLEFIRQSPVNQYMDHFTDGMKATGNADLNLALHMPLEGVDHTQVNGRIRLADNDIVLDDRLPPLTRVSGGLDFTDASVKGSGITARLYDQPLTLGLASEGGGRIHATASGRLEAPVLGRWLPESLGQRITGGTPVQADVDVKQHVANLKVESALGGLAIDLPAPIGKPAEVETPFTLTVEDRGDEQPVLAFRYGDVMSGKIAAGEMGRTRLSLMLGGQPAPAPSEDGITVAGTLRHLDLDIWRKLDLGPSTGNGLPIRSINLTLNELQTWDRLFHDINLRARPEQDAWNLKLDGREIAGTVRYGPKPGLGGDSFSGQLSKLSVPRPIKAATDSQPVPYDDLPREIDLAVQSLDVYDKHLGSLKLRLSATDGGFVLEDLRLSSEAAQLKMKGWLSDSPRRRTHLGFDLKSANLGSLMQQFDYKNAVKGGVLDAQGDLSWLGRPETFDLSKLDGRFQLALNNGRFLQLDPGAAKLLGILSLQALPRRITLDFRDVFSQGFAFDSIRGPVILDRGVGYLPGMSIKGPAASIEMKGKIDLARESQDLRLHIQPRLDEGVAVGAALLGGPVIGVGALVASKLLQNPVSQAASFEYLVTGTWDDPVVTKLARSVVEIPGTIR